MCTCGSDVVVLTQSWTHIALAVFMFSCFFPDAENTELELKLCMTHLSPPYLVPVSLYFLDPNTPLTDKRARHYCYQGSDDCCFVIACLWVFPLRRHIHVKRAERLDATHMEEVPGLWLEVFVFCTQRCPPTLTLLPSTVNSEGMWADFNCIWTLTRCMGGGGILFIWWRRNSFRNVKFKEHGPWVSEEREMMC